MKRSSFVPVILLCFCSAFVQAADMGLPEVQPAKGDKCVYKIFEQTSSSFEGTPLSSSTRGFGTQTTEVVALSKGEGKTVHVVLTSRSVKSTQTPSGKENTTTSYSMDTCRTTPRGLWIDSNWTWEDGEDSSIDVGTTFLQMRLPCAPGTSWRGGRISFKEGFSVRPFCEATGYEDIETPAGTFKSCLKVVSSSPEGIEGWVMQEDHRLEIVSGELSVTSWYYPRVGLVKEVSVTNLRVRPEGIEEAAILKMITASTLTLQEYK